MATLQAPVQGDLASSLGRMTMIWGPGALLIALTSSLGGWSRTIGMTAGLVWLSAFCFWNGARCGRVHCVFTGPFFLAMAAATLLVGLGVASLGRDIWNVLSATILIGGAMLCCIPEIILGRRYWRASGGSVRLDSK
jgi:hypothetical protein